MDITRLGHLMYPLSERERTWLVTVLDLTKEGPVAMDAIWKATWFTRASRRALITHASHACAYLYLDHAEFLETGSAEREAAQALNLAIFLAFLKAHGAIFTFTPAPATRPDIQYLGEIFENPHVEMIQGRQRIILNVAGDYTEEPDVIRDQTGRVIYSSICFDQDVFELLRSTTQGVVHVRPQERLRLLESLMPASPGEQPDLDPSSLATAGTADIVATGPDILAPSIGLAETCDNPGHVRGDTHAAHVPSSNSMAEGFEHARVTETRVTIFQRVRRSAKESILHWAVVGVLSALHGAVAGWYAKDYLRPRPPVPAIAAAEHRPGQPVRLAHQVQLTKPTQQASALVTPLASATAVPASAAPVASAATADGSDSSKWAGRVTVIQPAALNQRVPETPAAARHDSLTLMPHGVDVSKWSGSGKSGAEEVFNFLPSLDFAFARVAYGTYVDPEFQTNWLAMGRRQIYRGAYLFLRLDQDPVQQVDAAIRAIQYTSQKDLCLAIDFEELSFPETSPAPSIEAVQKVVSTALKRAASRLKCRPMLYTNPDVGDKYLNSPDFARYPLWIADWSQSPAPKLPAAWSNFAFWQRADHIKASPEPVDLDIFNGELSELAHLSRTLGRSAAIVSGQGSPQ